MKNSLILVLAVATAVVATPAGANAATPGEVIDVTFLGNVTSSVGGTSYAIGDLVGGQFVYNASSNSISSFSIDLRSIPAGFTSTAEITPGLTDAIYQAQVSPVTTGGSVNATFSLDLSSLTTWPSNDAAALLTNTSQLTTNLDTISNPLSAFPSTFGYYTASADGSNVLALTADLTAINFKLPEPASLLLLLTSLLGLAATRRRA